MNDLISVIVPVYNVESYLDRCVQSIVDQTYKNIEIILVDDGSTDSSKFICDMWAGKDSRIKVIHNINGGSAYARNIGLSNANGDYISFVDSDDWISDNFLFDLLLAMKKSKSEICECNYKITMGEDVCSHSNTQMKTYNTTEALRLLINNQIFHQVVWDKLYHRSVLEGVTFPVGKFIDDEFWTYKVFGNAKRVTKVFDVLYNYYQHQNSVMNSEYSLRRLDGLQAKYERQKFIEEKFPELGRLARLDLFGTCIYAGQMSLIYLQKDEILLARKIIKDTLINNKPLIMECIKASGSNKIWYSLARISFWHTCHLKNKLNKGF